MSEWAPRLRKILKEKGWSQAELGRRADIEYENVKKYYAGKVDGPRGDIMWKIATALGVTEQWLRTGNGPKFSQVPIIGYASGGEEWTPVDNQVGGAPDYVDFVIGAADPIGIAVRGQSMSPVYRPGDILMCARMPATEHQHFIRRDAVVLTADGRSYVKFVLPGETAGRFRLRSYNTEFEDIAEVELTWVAPVIWIKRSWA